MTKTTVKTKTKVVVIVAVVAAAALLAAGGIGFFSLRKQTPKVCVGGSNNGRLCVNNRQCRPGGKCKRKKLTSPTTRPTKPTSPPPLTKPASILKKFQRR